MAIAFNENISTLAKNNLQVLRPGETHVEDDSTLLRILYDTNRLQIYCRLETPLTWRNVFQTVYLQLDFQKLPINWKQYREATAREIEDAHHTDKECYDGKFLTKNNGKTHEIELPAHKGSCYGIYTNQPYNLTLVQMRLDHDRLGKFLTGSGLWITSPFLMEFPSYFNYVTFGVGFHLTILFVVYVRLFLAGDPRFIKLMPLMTNFNTILEQNIFAVYVTLIAGGWLMQKYCQRWRWLWHFSWIRYGCCCLFRFVSCLMISSTAEFIAFRLFVLWLVFPFKKLWQLLNWLCSKYNRRHLKAFPSGPIQFDDAANYPQEKSLSITEMAHMSEETAILPLVCHGIYGNVEEIRSMDLPTSEKLPTNREPHIEIMDVDEYEYGTPVTTTYRNPYSGCCPRSLWDCAKF